MRISIGRRYTVEAAHYLPYHAGKCHNLHGHSYKIEVVVSGTPQNTGESEHGMVMDFSRLDERVHDVIDQFDHNGTLNEIMPAMYPTAERLAQYIFGAVVLPTHVRMERVVVWETERSYAEVRRDQ